MPAWSLPLAALIASTACLAVGGLLVRRSGAPVRMARRLAGAREYRVGDLAEMDPLPDRPVRLNGRIRCPDPIVTPWDERLVVLHRDVDVRTPGGAWRTIERLRESRGFELWDHDGSLSLDPADAAEPLVAIPHVWQGSPDELQDATHRAAVARLSQEGQRPTAARSVTRMVSVVDRVLVLAHARREGEDVVLSAPGGGFVISSLELPDAMRLLGGPRRRWLLAGAALLLAGVLLAITGLVGFALTA